MIKQEIYIEKYDWTIYAFYHHSHYDVDDIMETLWRINCDASTAKKAYENLTTDSMDMGLCYSNYNTRESVFVVGKTSSAAEFANSWHHELSHLQSHIAKAYNLDALGEPIAYLTGSIAMKMFPAIQGFLCEECRRKIYHERTHGEDRGYGVSEHGRLTPYYE